MSTTTSHSTWALAVAATLLACQASYSDVTLEPISTPPVIVDIRPEGVEVPAGIAVAVQSSPRSRNATPFTSADRFALVSQDEDVLLIERTPDPYQWIFIGVSAGSTCIEVRVNGAVEECIDAEVTAQPSG